MNQEFMQEILELVATIKAQLSPTALQFIDDSGIEKYVLMLARMGEINVTAKEVESERDALKAKLGAVMAMIKPGHAPGGGDMDYAYPDEVAVFKDQLRIYAQAKAIVEGARNE